MPPLESRAHRALGALLLALLVAGASHLAIRSVAVHMGEDPGRNRTWVHWDAYRYIDVARHGYLEAIWDPLASNTGWFPGYPVLIRGVAEAGSVGLARSGRIVSAVAFVGFLLVLQGALLPSVDVRRRVLALLIAAFFPGWVYFHAVFPQSTLVLFTLASVALAARRQWALAGLVGALAAFTYPTGIFVALPLAVLAARDGGARPGERARAVALAPGLTTLGLGAVAIVHQVQVGHWDAYARFQGHLGAGLHNPLRVLGHHLGPLVRLEGSDETVVALDVAVTCVLLGAAALVWWRHRHDMRTVDTGLLLYAIVLWVFVNAAGPNLSIYRQAAALVCLAPILARLPSLVLLALLAVLVPQGLAMARLFFLDVLV